MVLLRYTIARYYWGAVPFSWVHWPLIQDNIRYYPYYECDDARNVDSLYYNDDVDDDSSDKKH